MTGYQVVRSALEARGSRRKGNDWQCPAHDDANPSLGLTEGEEGRAVLYCQAGCSTEDVVRVLGLTMADLFSENGTGRVRGEPIAWYDYKSADGELVFQKLRYYPKDFKLRRPDGNGGWVWGLGGGARPIYRLPEVRSAVAAGRTVYVVEGEKDADAVSSAGAVATCNFEGAAKEGQKPKWRDDYSVPLAGADVIVVADRDEAGYAHARAVAESVERFAASVRLVEPAKGKDAADHLAAGLGLEEFIAVRETMDVEPSAASEPTPLESVAPSREELFEGSAGFVPPLLGEFIEREGQLRIGPDGSPWRYVEGVFRPDGDDFIAQRVRDILGEEFRANRLREVLAWCHANTASRLATEPTTEFINLRNGLLFWKEDPPELRSHSPEAGSVIQLPVFWDPVAECPRITGFFSRVLPPDETTYRFLFEWIGYCLIPTQRFKRALMLLGPTDTAKSTLLALIESLLGTDNVSNATLQSIAEDRFTAGSLYGKLANIAADLDARALKSTGMFKTMTGGEDRIQSDRKYRDFINFKPTARLMFSANEAPGTADQSSAYYNRWLILPMTRTVDASKQDRNLIDSMTTPAELSGLLRYAVAALGDLTKRGRLVPSEVMEEALREYRRRTDTIVGHAEERLIFDPDERTRCSVIYEDYKAWCQASSRYPLGAERYKEQLLTTYADRIEFKPRYSGYPTWAGLRLAGPRDQQEG